MNRREQLLWEVKENWVSITIIIACLVFITLTASKVFGEGYSVGQTSGNKTFRSDGYWHDSYGNKFTIETYYRNWYGKYTPYRRWKQIIAPSNSVTLNYNSFNENTPLADYGDSVFTPQGTAAAVQLEYAQSIPLDPNALMERIYGLNGRVEASGTQLHAQALDIADRNLQAANAQREREILAAGNIAQLQSSTELLLAGTGAHPLQKPQPQLEPLGQAYRNPQTGEVVIKTDLLSASVTTQVQPQEFQAFQSDQQQYAEPQDSEPAQLNNLSAQIEVSCMRCHSEQRSEGPAGGLNFRDGYGGEIATKMAEKLEAREMPPRDSEEARNLLSNRYWLSGGLRAVARGTSPSGIFPPK